MAERRVANPRIGAYHARPIVTHAPPDPRFADLIRRIQEDARPRFQSAPCSPESRAAIDEEIALDRGAQRPHPRSDGPRRRPALHRPRGLGSGVVRSAGTPPVSDRRLLARRRSAWESRATVLPGCSRSGIRRQVPPPGDAPSGEIQGAMRSCGRSFRARIPSGLRPRLVRMAGRGRSRPSADSACRAVMARASRPRLGSGRQWLRFVLLRTGAVSCRHADTERRSASLVLGLGGRNGAGPVPGGRRRALPHASGRA
jgi:hypothetical protein